MKFDDPAIAALGASLQRIDGSLMKSTNAPTGKKRIWYQGVSEAYFDVMAETSQDKLIWFQITFRGKYVSWQAQSAHIRTGETDELQSSLGASYYAASKTMQDSATINWPLVDLMRAILAHRPEDSTLSAMGDILQQQLIQRPRKE